LVRVNRWLYIVADDDHHLGQLDASDILASRVLMVRFGRTDLPADAAQRKRTKPDLETLIHIPATAPAGNSLLVALGSASHPRRERAFVFTLDSHGERAQRSFDALKSSVRLPQKLLEARPDGRPNPSFAAASGTRLRSRGHALSGAANMARQRLLSEATVQSF
jgi:hypothetical protein